MSKKQDEKIDEPIVVIIQADNETTPVDVAVEPEKTGSLIVPLEQYLDKIEPEYHSIAKTHRQTGFPDLFKPAKVDNDKESVVSELITSRPIRIFTALHKARYEKLLKEVEDKSKLSN